MKVNDSVTVLLSHKDFNAMLSDALRDVVNKPYKSDIVVEGSEIGDDDVTIIYHLDSTDET